MFTAPTVYFHSVTIKCCRWSLWAKFCFQLLLLEQEMLPILVPPCNNMGCVPPYQNFKKIIRTVCFLKKLLKSLWFQFQFFSSVVICANDKKYTVFPVNELCLEGTLSTPQFSFALLIHFLWIIPPSQQPFKKPSFVKDFSHQTWFQYQRLPIYTEFCYFFPVSATILYNAHIHTGEQTHLNFASTALNGAESLAI